MHCAAEIPAAVKETAGITIPAAVAEEATTEETMTEEDVILTVAAAEGKEKMTAAVMTAKGEEA